MRALLLHRCTIDGGSVLRRITRWQLRGPVAYALHRPVIIQAALLPMRLGALRLLLTVRRGKVSPHGLEGFPFDYVVAVDAHDQRTHSRLRSIYAAVNDKIMKKYKRTS